MLPESIREKIRAMVPRYPSKRAVTLPALHLVHEHFRCVPRRAMAEIAEMLEVTAAEVHDTMSFYGFFPQAPIGDVRVWVCRSISCMLRGGDELIEHACRREGVHPGGTTADGKLTVEFAECLGLCDYAPAALADDGRFFGPLDEPTVDRMLDLLKEGPAKEAPITPVLHGRAENNASSSPARGG
jgi:NADH-quinone oxidoreductase subunit E